VYELIRHRFLHEVQALTLEHGEGILFSLPSSVFHRGSRQSNRTPMSVRLASRRGRVPVAVAWCRARYRQRLQAVCVDPGDGVLAKAMPDINKRRITAQQQMELAKYHFVVSMGSLLRNLKRSQELFPSTSLLATGHDTSLLKESYCAT
jgi:hypothetical protein